MCEPTNEGNEGMGEAQAAKDRVMLALGLVEGKSWPEDAAEPGPHYWRVPKGNDNYTVHISWCHHALRSSRRLPWFAADGIRPIPLLVQMEDWPWYSPCRVCWHWQLLTVETFGWRMALSLSDAAVRMAQ